MANSEQLRQNINQHKPKNIRSKKDDKNISIAMQEVIEYLNGRFKEISNFNNFYIEYQRSLSIGSMIDNIKSSNVRKQFDTTYEKNSIQSDGGFLILKKEMT